MTFQYHPEAAKELTSSIQYYEEKSIGLGAEFLDEIEEAIAQALAHPNLDLYLPNKIEGFYLTVFPMKLFMTFQKI